MKRSKDFWDELPKPFFALAPMADVTDVAFRSMFQKYGPPQIYWTEFVTADGLLSPGREIIQQDLLFEENQRPIVAQLFTSKPENIYKAGILVKEMGFDGLDINMGCPHKIIEKQGCGAHLIKTPNLAVKIIESAKKTGLPISVKTRIGYNKEEIDIWIPTILKTKIRALSVHLRTRKEMSDVPANWECIKRIKKLRDEISPDTLIIGNGDVESIEQAERLVDKYKIDGVMIGSGLFGNPWFFNKKTKPRVIDKLNALIEHTKLFEEKLDKSFSIMKRHYKSYVQGFDGAKELRIKLMEEAENAKDVEEIVKNFTNKSNTVS